ncbi:uncharacterized protein H6S33_002451 [Morchella sextelata]|uniref:uncharacterized protein n=1 Tax=Morchella sextelata TaxID=1174677 RepID=UPI001D040C66|nr:uncharacterized protein H6S33_002451 [Morchella sextelata]KAH0607417.1 hypothetical protein H6S33_002451 [Morchella sextelata]
MDLHHLHARDAKWTFESYFLILEKIPDEFRPAFLTIIFGSRGNRSRPRGIAILRCQVLLSAKCVGTLENNFGSRMKKKMKGYGKSSQQASQGRYS